MLQVKQIFDDSKQRYGAEKIRVILGENGIHVGKERIRKIMNELGLVSIREDSKSSYKKRQQYQKRNLLNQEFKVKRQNEIVILPISRLRTTLYTSASLSTYSLGVWWGGTFREKVVPIL